MHDLEILQRGGYNDQDLARLKLTCALDSFPLEIFELGQTLEQLDLSGTGLAALPPDFGPSLPNLKIAFFSQCAFTTFPQELASCPQLEMVAFRGNGMTAIPEDALPPRLRWLILTDNRLAALPRSIGRCARLQKCMLAGNRLDALPAEMQACRKLGLLRLSANKLAALPGWLFDLPELAFLSLAGNPCATTPAGPPTEVGTDGSGHAAATTDDTGGASGTPAANGHSSSTSAEEAPSTPLAEVAWADLQVLETLGEGASGIIYKGVWRTGAGTTVPVAIKLFKGTLTSDGTPAAEMAACIAAGQHANIIAVLGTIHGHPADAAGEGPAAFRGGLVMQLVPPHCRALGLPPSLQSCTRDTFAAGGAGAALALDRALGLLRGAAAAAAHLHARGVAHGDLYAHNILASADGHALLGDFGAATVYGPGGLPLWERLEVLAFAHLVEDVVGLVIKVEGHKEVLTMLRDLHKRCADPRVASRPQFAVICQTLKHISSVPLY